MLQLLTDHNTEGKIKYRTENRIEQNTDAALEVKRRE